MKVVESLIADFVQLSSAIAKALLVEGKSVMSMFNFEIFLKCPYFS